MNYCGFMNSVVCLEYLGCMSPTLNFEVGQINRLPIIELDGNEKIRSEVVSEKLIQLEMINAAKDLGILPVYPYLLAPWRQNILRRLRAPQGILAVCD